MASTMTPPGERYSWEQFLELPDLPDGSSARALIDGEVIYVAPPSPLHGYVIRRLVMALGSWCDGAPGRGDVFPDPLVRVGERPLGYEGDLGWFPAERLHAEAGDVVLSGLPALVAEVWSPSNWPAEQALKQHDYALAGVDELWGVFPKRQVVVRMTEPTASGYDRVVELPATALLTSPLLPAFELEIAALFPR